MNDRAISPILYSEITFYRVRWSEQGALQFLAFNSYNFNLICDPLRTI